MKTYFIRYADYGGVSSRFIEAETPKKAVNQLCFDCDIRLADIISVYEHVSESAWR